MRKLNIAIVGAGGIAGAHIEGYRDMWSRGLKAFEVKAVCDVSEKNALSRSEEIEAFQGSKPKVYLDLESMLKNESLDASDLCLPHNVHHTVATQCLKEGLNVIIEKPLGITMRAAKLIVDRVHKTGKVLAVAENYRLAPEQRAFWWAIKQGLIGEPRMVIWAAISWGPRPWGWREDKMVAGGSWVFDGGVHWADLDRYQLGREATEVLAMTHTFDKVRDGVKTTVDDMTMAIIRFEGDVYSQWIWTKAAPAKGMWMHLLYGSKGALSNDGLQIQKEESIVETQTTNTLVNNMKKNLKPEEIEGFFPKGSTNTFAIELHDFYQAIINKTKPEVDVLEGYKDMAIPMGFYESANLGRKVKISDIEELQIEGYQKEINEKLGL